LQIFYVVIGEIAVDVVYVLFLSKKSSKVD